MMSESETLRSAIATAKVYLKTFLKNGDRVNLTRLGQTLDEAQATPRDVPVEVNYTGLEVRGG